MSFLFKLPLLNVVMANYKENPTIADKTYDNFNARSDAEELHNAMKGMGTDEDTLIKILCHRTNSQRVKIAETYKALYGKDLRAELESELSGNFKKVMVCIVTPVIEFYADQLHHAISGLGTTEEALIEFMVTPTNSEMIAIRREYEKKYGRSLESDLQGDTSGTFRQLMLSLCSANREEHTTAQHDAKQLLKDGEPKNHTLETRFTEIFCRRSFNQLQDIFHEYEKLTGHTIEEGIDKEFSSDAKSCLIAIVEFVKNKYAFFAKRLHESMQGMGTNDDQLIRLIVARSEIDMDDIKKEYEKMYCKSLKHDIHGDTSGDYRKALMCLIGEHEY